LAALYRTILIHDMPAITCFSDEHQKMQAKLEVKNRSRAEKLVYKHWTKNARKEQTQKIYKKKKSIKRTSSNLI